MKEKGKEKENEMMKIDRKELEEDVSEDGEIPMEFAEKSVNKVRANEKYYQHDVSEKDSKDSKNAIGKIVTAIRFISNSLIRRPFLPNKGEIVEVQDIENSPKISVTLQYAKPRVATEDVKKAEKTIEYNLEDDKENFDFLLKKGNASKPSDLIGQKVPIDFLGEDDEIKAVIPNKPQGVYGILRYYILRLRTKLKLGEASTMSGGKEYMEYNKNAATFLFMIFFGSGFVLQVATGSVLPSLPLYAFSVLFSIAYLIGVLANVFFGLREILFKDSDEREYIERIIKK